MAFIDGTRSFRPAVSRTDASLALEVIPPIPIVVRLFCIVDVFNRCVDSNRRAPGGLLHPEGEAGVMGNAADVCHC